MKKLVVLEPQGYEKLKPQNVEECILSNLDKRMEEILNFIINVLLIINFIINVVPYFADIFILMRA